MPVKVRHSPHHFAIESRIDGFSVYVPLVPMPWNNHHLVQDADLAFNQLRGNSLFQEVGIEVDPNWLLGAGKE
jgi:hypothetical protein